MHFCRLCPNAVLALRYGQPALSNTGAKLASQPRIPVIFCMFTNYVDSLNNMSLPLPPLPLLLPLRERAQGNHKVMFHMALAEYAGSNHVLIRERG